MTLLQDLYYKVMEKPEWVSLESVIENKEFDHLFVKKNNTVTMEMSDLQGLIFAFLDDVDEYLEQNDLILSCNKTNKENKQ